MMRSHLLTPLFFVLRALLLVAALTSSGTVAAAGSDGIEVLEASLEPHEEGWAVNAQFAVSLTPGLDQALERGLSLYFVVDFELTRPRWYWFDDKTAAASTTFRLSYHPLTRQYRVSTGNLQLGFPTLAEAIGVMARIRDWQVLERGDVRPGGSYVAALRMRLDTGQLPKPFQLNAMTSRDWSLESGWHRFAFEVPR
jgi:hypothetical protein